MNDRDAIALLRDAVPVAEGVVWADLGAGTGVFTRPLASLLPAASRIYAADADENALRVIAAWARAHPSPPVATVQADVSRPLGLPPLDGVVMANVLHFIADAVGVLSTVAAQLRPGGRLVLVEYEGRRPGPWVPYPVSAARFAALASGAGLSVPRVVATRPSAFGGELYVAVADRVGGSGRPAE